MITTSIHSAQAKSKNEHTLRKGAVQLVREWPPGYGGVERVAHELAKHWEAPVFSLDAKGIYNSSKDPLPANYKRIRLPRALIGRIAIPAPSLKLLELLTTNHPLHIHLPCPSVLSIALLARIIKPRRTISVHWHAFLETDYSISGLLIALYQRLAIIFCKFAIQVITTSPDLKDELVRVGCKQDRVKQLPCCIDIRLERKVLAAKKLLKQQEAMRILFVGRLDSYKRVDWLLESVQQASSQLNNFNAFEVEIAGDGPNYKNLILQSQKLYIPIRFLGIVDENKKIQLLESADILVLPSSQSNEAFGIVQLEAMAAGTPALAFDMARSGMSWVSKLDELKWSHSPEGLADALILLKQNPILHETLCLKARARYLKHFSRKIWEKQLNEIFK